MADEVKIEISAVDKTASAVASVKRSLSGIEQSASKIQTAFKGLETGMGNALRSAGTGMAMGAGMGLFNMLSSLPGAFMQAGGAAMQSYAQYERLSMSLNSLTAKEALQAGQASTMAQAMSLTSGKAKELVDWIQKLAVDSPFDSTDISATFRMAMGMGFLSQEAQRVTKDMLDFVSATGAQPEVMERITLALGKVRTTGKITGETLQQLGEAGVNATQILADAFGKTPKQIADDISKGKVDSDKALDEILKSIEKFYGGAAKAQSTSISGILSSLSEISDNTLRDFFAPMFQGAQPYMAELTNQLSSPEFKAVVGRLGELMAGGIGGGLAVVVKGAQDVSTALLPLLQAGTPGWMTILAALFQAGGGKFDLTINPKFPENSGIKFDVGSGAATFDFTGKLKQLDLQGFAGGLTTIHYDPSTGWQIDFHGHLLGIEGLSVEDANKWLSDANNKLSGQLTAMVTLTAEWGAGVLSSAWDQVQAFFRGRPVQLGIITTPAPVYGPSMTPAGTTSNTRFPTDVTQPYPETSIWDVLPKKASGGPVQGWAMVGERGAELAFFGRNGGHVFSNPDTRKMLGSIPGYADGSFGPSDVGNMIRGWIGLASGALGINKGPTYGPKTREEAMTWQQIAKDGTAALQQTAKAATDAFEAAAKKAGETFKGALGSVPGIGGLSQVTDLDMQKAKAGMKVNYADDYIRQLSDEVLNKKEWGPNIDIKDAAKRAGIDPNLPNELILELVKQAWADKSFFANPANLQLINQGAVQSDMEQKQKEMQGNANILGLFGLDNTNESQQAALLGQAIANTFGAIPQEIFSSTGASMMLHISTGFADTTATGTAITNMGSGLTAAMGTEAGAAVTNAVGVNLADGVYSGYVTRMGQLPPVPPTGTTPPTGTPPGGTTTPPGKAVGAANYYGGWTRVHKDETIYLPQGASVYTAAESQRMGGGGAQVIQVTVASALDEEAVVNRLLQKIRRRMS